jgi:hypothetical protein
MDALMRRRQSFLLRLPISVRDQAARISCEEGTSLNHFIAIAVAEKLSRMDYEKLEHKKAKDKHQGSIRPLQIIR